MQLKDVNYMYKIDVYKDILYNTRNDSQYPVITFNGV